MQIYSMEKLLADANLCSPNLRALNPNHENYSALLLQPQGDIEFDVNGVRNTDRALAGKQYSAFLSLAASEQSALAITPEYSMPWQTLEESLNAGTIPSTGSLWILGCESIKQKDLSAFKNRMAGIVNVLFEDLPHQSGRFLDPVVYIFSSRSLLESNNLQLVIVVQFKTSPMGDNAHFEINGLQIGSRIYAFGNGTTQLRLATLICSDAFAFLDQHAQDLYNRALLIHIQLNKAPRQAQFRRYRDKMLQYDGDETEILCLNWAKDVHERCGDAHVCWNNLPCSAWYLRPVDYDASDSTLTENHKRGLYYTWLNDLRCRALYFTYLPAVFAITASKVAHYGVMASLSRRRGPILTETRVWDENLDNWVVMDEIADGFADIVNECGDAKADIQNLASANPFSAERTLALCAGKISEIDWYSPKKLDSCLITTSEIVRRITACQDTADDAPLFRTHRLRTAHRVASILRTQTPAALADILDGFRFDWSSQSPHTNIVSTTGRRATAIYLGDTHTPESAYAIAAKAADHIGQWEKTPNSIVEGRQRLHVWYRNNQGDDVPCEPDRYMQFDETHTESPFDITRAV